MNSEREVPVDVSNPLGLDGIEFVEYATSRPQALGQVLETMGFSPNSAASLARGAAVPAGRHEHHHQFACQRIAAQRATVGDTGDHRGVFARARRTRPHTSVRSSAAPGRCPRKSK